MKQMHNRHFEESESLFYSTGFMTWLVCCSTKLHPSLGHFTQSLENGWSFGKSVCPEECSSLAKEVPASHPGTDRLVQFAGKKQYPIAELVGYIM